MRRCSVLLVLTLLAGCQGPVNENGPLAVPRDQHGLCFSEDVAEVTFGELIWNEGDIEATITEVSLAAPEGLALIEVSVMPYPAQESVFLGSSNSYPPVLTETPKMRQEWEDREPAVGAVLAPGDERQLAVGLRVVEHPPPTTFPRIDGLLIEYQSGGQEYQARTTYYVGVGCTGDEFDM